ncbi:unnamed protein product, partial [Ectocarpus sp. 4 AP-2014]
MGGDEDEDKSGCGNNENETTAAAEEDSVPGTAADDQKLRNSSAREGDEKASNRGSDDGSAKSDKDADEAASPTEDRDEGGDGEGRENSTGEASVSKGSGGGGTSAGDREKQSGESGAGSRSNSVVSEKVGDIADDGDAEKSEDEGGESKGDSTGKTSEDPLSSEEKKSGDPEPDAQGGESSDSATSASAEKGKDSEAAKNDVGAEGKSDGSQGTKLEKGVAGEGGVLAIDVATANGEKNVDGGPAFDIASKESSCVEEDIDEMEVDLDKPWEKPSTERAKRAGKRMIWNNGMRNYFSTSIKEIGSMGVGMYLYFWMVRIVAIMFCICAFLSIPAMVLNHEGNAGMAISETDVDSLGLVALSYGNQGLNPDLVVESGCISSNGTVDCTGETVQVMGEAKDVLWVGYILVGGEILIAIFFLFFIVILSERLKAKIDEIDDANVTPGDYTVMVRGLPADVTKEEVRQHFSDLYSLVTPSPSYPFLGVSTTGVGLFWGSTLGLLFGLLVAPSVVEYAQLGTGTSAFGMGVCTVLLCVLSVYTIVEGCAIGRPRKRDTPLQEWEKGRKQREKNKRKAAASSSKYSAAPGKVIPVETAPDAAPAATGAANGDSVIAKEFDGAATAHGSAGEMARLEEGAGGGGGGEAGRLIPPLAMPITAPDAQPPEGPSKRSFPDERPPDPLPCQSCLNTHDKSFVGGWVADVVLGNPVGDVLMGFMDQEEALAEISKARTVVRQMKTLGKAKKLAKAEAKLAKLKAKEA